jgi:hypothetical protein
VRKRQNVLREEINIRQEMLTGQQMKYKKANDNLKLVTKRKVTGVFASFPCLVVLLLLFYSASFGC